MTVISQREARLLRKRVAVLEDAEFNRRRAWCQEWFGGVEIGRAKWEATAEIPVAVRTARKLRHAVVVVGDNTGEIQFIALPLPETE